MKHLKENVPVVEAASKWKKSKKQNYRRYFVLSQNYPIT